MEVSIILHEKESELLSKYMKDNNIKTKAEAVRKCIEIASRKLSIDFYIEKILRKNY